MKTVDKYLFKEIFGPFWRTVLFLSVLMVFGQMLKLAEQFSAMGLSATAIAKAICYSFAPSMSIIFPLSILVANILAFGRLAADGELTAFSASGMPFFRLLVAPLMSGILVAAAAMFFSVYGEVWGIKSLQKLLSEAVKESLTQEIQPGIFYNWIPGIMVYADGRQSDHTLERLLFVDGRQPDGMMAVSANRGKLMPYNDTEAIRFHLSDGEVLLTKDQELTRIQFESNDYLLDLGKLANKGGEGMFVKRQGMTLQELERAAVNKKYSRRDKRTYLTAYHKKLALPLASILFALLGAMLASWRNKSSLAGGLIIGVIVIGLYYYVLRTGELSAIKGKMIPWLAMWLPDMIFSGLTVGCILFKSLKMKG